MCSVCFSACADNQANVLVFCPPTFLCGVNLSLPPTRPLCLSLARSLACLSLSCRVCVCGMDAYPSLSLSSACYPPRPPTHKSSPLSRSLALALARALSLTHKHIHTHLHPMALRLMRNTASRVFLMRNTTSLKFKRRPVLQHVTFASVFLLSFLLIVLPHAKHKESQNPKMAKSCKEYNIFLSIFQWKASFNSQSCRTKP